MPTDAAADPVNTQPQAVERSEGVTSAERYLKRLAERTFLSPWSYAGVFRDQGRQGSGDGKEVADLLVVFDRHIIIFSDKDCVFSDSVDLELGWQRWFRKAVWKSAEQIRGAERFIQTFPDRLYLDRKCTQRFPIPLPDPAVAKFHPIVVAHEVSDRCRKELGGTGSLMIAPGVVGDMHMARKIDGGTPFTIGQLDPTRGFVHVLDDTSLNVLMGALDTVTDFVNYLTKKERFIESDRLVFAAGEEDLLAWYLKDIGADGEHDFIMPNGIDALSINEGFWTRFESRPERQAKLEADRISYAWDRLIEEFAGHALAGTQYYTTQAGIGHAERVLRFMAREPRTRCRMLARILVNMIETTLHAFRRTVVVEPLRQGDPHYVFLLVPPFVGVPEAEYREVRRNLLEVCCKVTRLMYPDATDIVGVATESGNDPEMLRSEDALYYDARAWTPEDEADARSLQQDLGLLTNVTRHAGTEREYPVLPRREGPVSSPLPGVRMKGRDRNAPCPCGSGRKFKSCCGV